jgi:hypothetical protein
MKKIVIALIAMVAIYSCSQNEQMFYDEKPAVYFADMSTDADSVVFSFLTTPENTAVVNLSVKLLGALYEDKSFSVHVNPESTAQEGVHYEALNETYTFPAGETTVDLPVHLLYSPDLDSSLVELSVRLMANDEMDTGYPNRLNARVQVTNLLAKPSYWESLLYYYFGEYSKVKHQICSDLMGHDFPGTREEAEYYNDSYTIYGYWQHAGREAAEYFAKNKVYDENGNLITTWVPY